MKKSSMFFVLAIVICGVIYVKDNFAPKDNKEGTEITNVIEQVVETVEQTSTEIVNAKDSLTSFFQESYDQVSQIDINNSLNDIPGTLRNLKIPLPSEQDIKYIEITLSVLRNLALDFSALNDTKEDPSTYVASIQKNAQELLDITPSETYKEVSEELNKAIESIKSFSQDYQRAYQTGDSAALKLAKKELESTGNTLVYILDGIKEAINSAKP